MSLLFIRVCVIALLVGIAYLNPKRNDPIYIFYLPYNMTLPVTLHPFSGVAVLMYLIIDTIVCLICYRHKEPVSKPEPETSLRRPARYEKGNTWTRDETGRLHKE
jgi:hypothetical protein